MTIYPIRAFECTLGYGCFVTTARDVCEVFFQRIIIYFWSSKNLATIDNSCFWLDEKKSPQKVQIQMKIVSHLWRCLISSWSCKTRVVAMGNFCFWLAETFKIVSTKISIISPIKQREIYYFTCNFVPLLLIYICKTNLVFFLSRLIFSMWVHHL